MQHNLDVDLLQVTTSYLQFAIGKGLDYVSVAEHTAQPNEANWEPA